jgi:glycogen synthase
MMKILVLNYEFPPVGGGGGKFSEDLCKAFARRGHEVRVQTAHFRGLPKIEKRDGFTISRTWAMRRRAHTCSVFEMGVFLMTNFLPALKTARVWKPDIMHVHFAVPTGVLGWVVSKASGIPYVLSTQLGDIPGGVPEQTDDLFRVVKSFTNAIWGDAAAVTVPSEHIRELAMRTYDVDVLTIPNTIDLENLPCSPPEPHTPVRMIFAGRFNPQKNLLFLVDVLGRISDLEWEMHMLGDGPMMESVRRRVGERGLEKRICLHGWVDSEKVEQAMAESDILVMPSLSEGLPLVGARALGTGLAIVGSDVGGIDDVVEDGVNGFLCPVNNHEAFEKALRTVITSPDRLRSMKSAGRDLAKRFDLRTVADHYERIFERVVI